MTTPDTSSILSEEASEPHRNDSANKAQPGSILTKSDIDRVIEMAWEDRTPFEAIEFQFGMKESEVKELMKREMKLSSYKMWRKRVEASSTKHARLRVAGINRFKSKLQKTITLNKISKRK